MAPVRPSGHDNPRSVSLCNLRRQMPAPPDRPSGYSSAKSTRMPSMTLSSGPGGQISVLLIKFDDDSHPVLESRGERGHRVHR